MGNDISAVQTLSVAARTQFAATPPTQQAADPKSAVPAKVEPSMPARPQIQYDPEEMRRNMRDAIKQLNEQMQKNQQNLAFRLDEAADRFVITVKNTQTGEVVRQIPDDVVLKIAHNINDLKGLLHNKTI